jgi:4-hydroxybenzoate polyprenyltransferase
LTPPPTRDNDAPRRESRFSVLRQKAVEAYYLVEDYFPRLTNGNAWLRLLRLPNLLTVPGDVLAGFLLAASAPAMGWVRLLCAFSAGWLLYAAGLILNDLFDYAEDLRDRPRRPLPSREISREAAATVALVCLWVAAFAAAFAGALPVAIPLIVCVILYNIGVKRHRILGPLLMGACRSGHLLLGAAAASGAAGLSPAPIAAAVLLGLYIAGVTQLARNEAKPGAKFTPAFIGQLLRLLIPLQALLCVAAIHRFPANLLGLALLPLLPLHRRLAARFPPS